MALWTEIVRPAELTAFSRTAGDALDVGALNAILPNTYQDEVKFSWRINEVLSELAEFGEFDTEAPIGGKGKSKEQTIRLIPVMLKKRLSEYEQVTDPERVRQLADDRAVEVVTSILNRLNKARAEALVTGKLELNENKVIQTVNFGRKASHTVTATTLWSATGADPIADLRGWFDLVSDDSGVMPDAAITSSRVLRSVGGALAGAGYITGNSPTVSQSVVNEVLAAFGLPSLTVDDRKIGGVRLVPDDRIIVAPTGGVAGATVYAPTVESSDPRFALASGDRSGIVAGLYREDDPPVAWVIGKAVALPILANPDTTLAAKVL